MTSYSGLNPIAFARDAFTNKVEFVSQEMLTIRLVIDVERHTKLKVLNLSFNCCHVALTHN